MSDAAEAKDLLLGRNKIEMKRQGKSIRFYMRYVSFSKDKKYIKQILRFILPSRSFSIKSKIFNLNLSEDNKFIVLEIKSQFSSDIDDMEKQWKEYENLAF